MTGVADLLIRVSADVSGAMAELQKLGGALPGAVSGNRGAIGAAVAAGTGVAVTGEIIANQYQDAMARIKAATSDGTENFGDLRTKLEDLAKSTNTPFQQIADSTEVWTRFFGSAGDGAVKATSAVAEFNKVSRDMTDATGTSQTVARFDRIFNSQDPTGTLNALAALGKMHTQGEQTVMDTAQMLAPTAQMMGMSQGQVLGVSNYLVEEGVGGQFAGTAIGRMMLNMGKSVSSAQAAEDDPEGVTAKQQAASDRIDDLHMSLQEAEEKKAEMFDSRGRMKRQYLRHPSEVTSIDNQITRLQRNAGEEQQKLADLNDPLKPVRGMAALAGEDEQTFIDQFRNSPFDALKAVAGNLHGKSPTEISSLLTSAGFKNQRDIRTLAALGVDPDLMNSMIGTADTQLATPSALVDRYQTIRDTRSQDIGSVRQGATSAMANDAEAVNQAVAQTGIFDVLKNVVSAFSSLPESVKTATELLSIMAGPSILKGIIGLFAGGTAAAAATGAASAAAGAAAAGASAAPALGAPAADVLASWGAQLAAMSATTAAAGATVGSAPLAAVAALLAAALAIPAAAVKLGADNPKLVDAVANDQLYSGPIVVDVGGVNVMQASNGQPPTLQQVLAVVEERITAAWHQSSTAPSRQLGGAGPF